jgi:replicative DNA helicase
VHRDLLEFEKGIIAGCLLNPEMTGKVIPELAEDDFQNTQCAIVYKTLRIMFSEGIETTLENVGMRMFRLGIAEKIGGVATLAQWVESDFIPYEVDYTIGIIKGESLKRQLITGAHKLIEACKNPRADVYELMTSINDKIEVLSKKKEESNFVQLADLLSSRIDAYEERARNKGKMIGVPTGFRSLDWATGGWQKTDLIIIGARPSVGKSAFMGCLAKGAASAGKRVGVWSLEMSKEQLADRIVSMESGVNGHNLRDGWLTTSDFGGINRASGTIYNWKVFVDDTPNNRIDQIAAKIKARCKTDNLDLVIIDYLQLVTGPKSENRAVEVSAISRSLKLLAKKLQIPIIALAQLNRKLAERTDKKPVMSDLRESGAIEQDADVIILLHRPNADNKDPNNPNKNDAEIILAKQRNGPTGIFKMYYTPETTTFHDLSKDGGAYDSSGPGF